MTKKNKLTMTHSRPFQYVIQSILFLFALMILSGCSGGGGGGMTAGGGVGGTGISIGTITAFGSVVVNDVDFNTENANVVVNGNSIGTGDSVVRNALALGMVVRVESQIRDDGTNEAERIVFNHNFLGSVTDIRAFDSIAKKITILGQIVIIDHQTHFKNTDFDSIATGNVIQVSGLFDGSGDFRATYLAFISDTKDPDDEVLIKGNVSEVNIPQRQFHINELLVDASEITEALPAEGQLVSVRGFLNDNDVLVASEIMPVDELGKDVADNVEIEGIVSKVLSPEDFILGTTPVQTDLATIFIGLAPDDIITGARLVVKGSLTDGRLLADEVIAEDKVQIEGKVEAINPRSDAFELTIRGLNNFYVIVSDLSRVFGKAKKAEDIQTGQRVKVLGYVAAADSVEARQVKVDEGDAGKVKLQGPVTGKSVPTLTVFNVDVDTNQIPDKGFESDSEGSLPREDFLDLVEKGDTVSLDGKLIDGIVVWKQIALSQE